MDKLSGEFILNSETNQKEESTEEKKEAPTQSASIKKLNSPHFYTAFGHNPEGITFAEQEEGEEVILLLRRHFVTNIPWILLSFFFFVIPLFLPFIYATFPIPSFSNTTSTIMLSLFYLFIFGFVLLNFALWYFHIGLITNLRIIDIDLSGILYRQVTAIRHESVEDVTYNQVGFISSLFNYGNIYIQTAGNEANVEFDRVPRPAKAADIISDLTHPV